MRRLVAALVLLAGCSPISHMKCRSWQSEGLVVSSFESCVKCADQHGTGSPEIVRGCAVGLDAARLMDSTVQLTR